MKTIAEIRIGNLELLVTEAGTLDAVATKVGSTSVYLSQVRNRMPDGKTNRPRELGSRMARRLETAFDKPSGWLDQIHEENPEAEPPALVLGEALSRLGPDARREALEFIRYKLERAEPHIASENLDRYSRAIDAFGTTAAIDGKAH